MKKNDEKFRIAYKNATVILSTCVDIDKIFPEYFMEKIKSTNGHLYKVLEGNLYMENVQQDHFDKVVQEELKKYVQEVDKFEEKTNYISDWEIYEDKLAFFQYVMVHPELRDRIQGFDVEEFKEIDELVKTKEFSAEEAINNFGIESDDLRDYEKNNESYTLVD